MITCRQGSSQAGPAGDDVAHEESMLGGGLGLSELNRSIGSVFVPMRTRVLQLGFSLKKSNSGKNIGSAEGSGVLFSLFSLPECSLVD